MSEKTWNIQKKPRGLNILDILTIQYFLSFAGICYSILYSDMVLILMFGTIMVFNAVLQLRSRKYMKEKR